MARGKRKGKIARRSVTDILLDVCTTCQQKISKGGWVLIDLVNETAKLGHEKCLEAALSLNAEKSAWDRDRSRKYAPGEKPSEDFGCEPVLHAAKNGRLQCLRLLIEEGLPMYQMFAIKPIVLAANNGHTECFNFLWEAHKKSNSISGAVQCAIWQGSEKCLKMMISAGFAVNHEFKEEYRSLTPLMMHINKDNVGIVQLLIGAGANVNQQNSNGNTPLLLHTCFGRLKCVKALIEAGANVNTTNERVETPLMMSMSTGNNKNVARSLLNKGANINILDNSGGNALTFLATYEKGQERYQEKFMILFAAGEKIDRQAIEAEEQKVPDHLQPQFNLKDICRRRIREHLLEVDPHTQLFGRVPKIGLPSLLTSYLLYDQTLDDDDYDDSISDDYDDDYDSDDIVHDFNNAACSVQ